MKSNVLETKKIITDQRFIYKPGQKIRLLQSTPIEDVCFSYHVTKSTNTCLLISKERKK